MTYNNSRQQVDFKKRTFSEKQTNQYQRQKKPWYNKSNNYNSKLCLQSQGSTSMN